MAAQDLSVDRMMPLELSASGSMEVSGDRLDGIGSGIEAVAVVSHSTALEDAVVRAGSVMETAYVSAASLRECRARPSPKVADWQRFVAIRVDEQQAAAMQPMIAAGATVVLDRHYNSLAQYRAHHRTLYAVRCKGGLAIRFLDFDEGRLILRPLAVDFPVQLVAVKEDETPADYIVGRVCLIMLEL